jgi:hypothetical protein
VGVQAQVLFTQGVPAWQDPQSSTLPQPSEMLPQVAPALAHVVGAQPQALFEHVCPGGHEPQSTTLPQPSEMLPQLEPVFAQVVGMHAAEPQRSKPPPPQTWPAGHRPQSRNPPQPSGTLPHIAPWSLQVLRRHLSSDAAVWPEGGGFVRAAGSPGGPYAEEKSS